MTTHTPKPCRHAALLLLLGALACGACDDDDTAEPQDAAIGSDASPIMSDTDAAMREPLDAGDAATGADAGVDAGSHPAPNDAGGDATLTPEHPESEYCGDALRDPLLEECDDGPDTDGLDPCSDACRVRDAPLAVSTEDDAGAPVGVHGTLGACTHVAAGTDDDMVMVFVDEAGEPRLQHLSGVGTRDGDALSLASDAAPLAASSPCVAALPGGRFVASFGDTSSGTPDVLLRSFSPHDGTLGATQLAHHTTAGPQSDADLLWTGKQLIVAYSDLLDVRYRAFDDALRPLHDGRLLGSGVGIESNVTLARFDGAWAAAYRANEGGFERLRVVASSRTWSTALTDVSPAGDRPALAALDDSHLLLVFSVGSDPLGTGTPDVSQLRIAVLDTAATGPVASYALVPTLEPYASNAAVLTQRAPSAVAADGGVYLAWENAAPLGSPQASIVLLARFTLDEDGQLVQEPEIALARTPAAGAQTDPHLTTTTIFPSGALLGTWQQGAGAHDELVFGLRPLPWLVLE